MEDFAAIDKHTADKKHISKHITQYCYVDSPIGKLMLAGCVQGLRMICFPTGPQIKDPLDAWTLTPSCFPQTQHELRAYFDGDLQEFKAPIFLEGTHFQKQVWAALLNVPYGECASYGDIAKAIDNPGSARAVGGANNANPIPIIVPCHRIIGANKSLTGFGGGLNTKKALLSHEAKYAVFPDRLL